MGKDTGWKPVPSDWEGIDTGWKPVPRDWEAKAMGWKPVPRDWEGADTGWKPVPQVQEVPAPVRFYRGFSLTTWPLMMTAVQWVVYSKGSPS